mmetsp:Transcript_14393/g.16089  ORF Transcript_14393/g.16089 Transcript_14393/m.16089 type:complete len:102 (+) Transcript_14393:40-345(+)|eukprot:CAMPEP_0205832054 /NCGR_PEP_ID=MMETSP0206-20130828/45908_1 /ASSEMBLY_ACC=CAM_ASM_000279 /TAXON_ID=36767 /ORGANISM="Euplotes focardii, Strain TN1" /LENGTH=101 /DNA_ID=CAMNT_0053137251 /DNA_START=40 /DNA_END=345 /DNA_ORIENTATION=-
MGLGVLTVLSLVLGTWAQDCNSQEFHWCVSTWADKGCPNDAGVEKMGPAWFNNCENYAGCITDEVIDEHCPPPEEGGCLSEMRARGDDMPEGIGIHRFWED